MALALSTDALRDVALQALSYAKQNGAEQAEAEASQGKGLNVTVRLDALETLEHNVDKGMGVTVYVDGKKGNASTGDFSSAAIKAAVDKAITIAKFTSADPCAGLADAAHMAPVAVRDLDLDLYHPWDVSVDAAVALAKRMEAAGFAVDKRIDNSEGASVGSSESEFVYANSHGFTGGYLHSGHTLSVALVATDPKTEAMERDYWYSSQRLASKLEAAEAVGKKAGERAIARLNPRKLSTQTAPVLFEPGLGGSFLGHGLGALFGGAQYRKTTFLLDSLGKQIYSPNVTLVDDPFIKQAYGSSPFDSEGVACERRLMVDKGVIGGYFLSAYSARKLGMQPTGNAGGMHNMIAEPTTEMGLIALAKHMGRGLLVTELMGSGVNSVTGDYSRGAAGFWIENGEIAYPVAEITIAGNLLELYQRIVHIGSDVDLRGSKHVGSVLVEAMQIAGT